MIKQFGALFLYLWDLQHIDADLLYCLLRNPHRIHTKSTYNPQSIDGLSTTIPTTPKGPETEIKRHSLTGMPFNIIGIIE